MSHIPEPLRLKINYETGVLKPYRTRTERHLSDLKDFYFNKKIIEEMLSRNEDPLIYDAYWMTQPPSEELLNVGSTIIYPGKVGDEYFHTKGHFHSKELTSEIYVTLSGKGIFLMQNRDGRVKYFDLEPETVIYVSPGWAHRVINTGKEKLFTFFICPADAGSDYKMVIEKGFRKFVVEKEGKPKFIDNPNYV